jgi:hypothetical protein
MKRLIFEELLLHFCQRSRLAAVPVFEKQSARQLKPIRMLMIKFSTKSHYKTVKPKLKTIDR